MENFELRRGKGTHGRMSGQPETMTSHASGVIFEEPYTPTYMENIELCRGKGTHGRMSGQTMTSHERSPKLSPSSPSPLPLASTSAAPAPEVFLPPPLVQLDSSPKPMGDNASQDKIQRDLEEISAFIKSKGFTSISHVHQIVHKYNYQGSSVLQQEQMDDWMDGMPKLLKAIQMSTKRQEPYVRKAFHRSILTYATDLLKVELDAFLLCKDNRMQASNIRSKTPSTPAFLRMAAVDITPDFLDSNVLGECEKVFSGSHSDWKGVSSASPYN